MTFKAIFARVLLAAALEAALVTASQAQETRGIFTIVGTAPPAQVAPLLTQANQRLPDLDIQYEQMRQTDIVSALEGAGRRALGMDLVLLPSPDLGIQLANEGHLAQVPVPPEKPHHSHWRQEVFAIFHDPAVLVLRADSPAGQSVPDTRQALVGMLQSDRDMLHGRVGLTNIGTAPQSYGFAVQDQLRSLLYWQVTQAFGSLGTRIFDTNQDLVAALRAGTIDVAYNVPLSLLTVEDLSTLNVAFMEDYTIALPWVAVAPQTSRRRVVAQIIPLLRTSSAAATSMLLSAPPSGEAPSPRQFQQVNLGPELLVFLDPLKKTGVLESWFPLVTGGGHP